MHAAPGVRPILTAIPRIKAGVSHKPIAAGPEESAAPSVRSSLGHGPVMTARVRKKAEEPECAKATHTENTFRPSYPSPHGCTAPRRVAEPSNNTASEPATDSAGDNVTAEEYPGGACQGAALDIRQSATGERHLVETDPPYVKAVDQRLLGHKAVHAAKFVMALGS